MKVIYFLVLILAYVGHASDIDTSTKEWRTERTNVYFENDMFLNTDNKYTSGFKISNVYFVPEVTSVLEKIPFIHNSKDAHFVSFALVQQIYTPTDTLSSQLVVDDRPYAGWTYLEYGMYQSSVTQLDSLKLPVGIVGKSSGGEELQTSVHKLRNIVLPQGWDNQLNDELGINLIYQHKWRYVPKEVVGVESNFIPFVLGSLGNVSTEAKAGVLMRFGWNPIADFGASSIDVGGENGIPIRTNCLCTKFDPWSFTFNITMGAKVVLRDIFLDGNSFSDSHSVEKETFVGYSSYGFSARYRHFSVDYIITDYTKQFTAEKVDHAFGSLLFSYVY